ncbi:hypothetical protein Psuf_013250 [Phytohabitans suffuscus]|uniref:Uncharacterized protein n=1 Tax=Phytohabitans suffuscus TaxID=624315 RepID=A0A6F8YD32_9ACTN|nr:hypothetical protein [Phytohabitans suffuscus]BCB84012.1 hypothetical protein Psuf_013250 [Phytohabitans suffuscus]
MPRPGGRLARPERGPPVVPGPHRPRQACVHHLAHRRVGERVLRAGPPHQQAAQPGERRAHRHRFSPQQGGDRLDGDRVAEGRGGAEQRAVALVQPAEAGGGDTAHPRGQRWLAALRKAVRGDRSRVLGGVTGQAAAERGEAAGEVSRQAGPVEQVPQQPPGVGRGERLQDDGRRSIAVAVGDHDGQRQGPEPPGKLGHERPGRRVGQVQVVEEQRQRGVGGAAPEDRQQRGLDGRVAARGRRGRQQPGEPVQDGRQLAGRHQATGPVAEPAARAGGCAGLLHPRLAADEIGERRVPAAAGCAVTHPPARPGRRERLAGQAGLACASGPGHPDECRHPLAERPRHPIHHSGQLSAPPDERHGMVGRGRRHRRDRPPDVDGSGLSGRGDRGKRRVAHPRPGGAARGGGDHDAARRGVGLHPGGGVDDVAADERLPAVADRVEVDHDLTGGDPDPRPHRCAVGRGEAGELALHVQAGEHRPVRVVLVGVGRAEDDEHRVPDVLLHDAPPAVHGAGHAPEVLALEGAHVFRIEPAGEAGVPDEIHEEHAYPAPLVPDGGRAGRRETGARGAVTGGPHHVNHDWPGAVPNRRYRCPEPRGRTEPITRRIRIAGLASPAARRVTCLPDSGCHSTVAATVL